MLISISPALAAIFEGESPVDRNMEPEDSDIAVPVLRDISPLDAPSSETNEISPVRSPSAAAPDLIVTEPPPPVKALPAATATSAPSPDPEVPATISIEPAVPEELDPDWIVMLPVPTKAGPDSIVILPLL